MNRAGGIAVLGLLGLCACWPQDIGYVEVKIQPGFVLPPLVLDTNRIDGKAGSAVFKLKTGPARLEYVRGGQNIPFCEFGVRKDRIVTVVVTASGRDPRCRVQE